MKAAIKFLIKFFLLFLVVYGLYFTLYRVTDDEIIVLRDLRENKNIDIFSTSPVSFILHGVMPWRYSVSKISTNYLATINIPIKLPALSVLDDDIYVIKLSADIGYKIDKTNLSGIIYLNSKDDINDYITKKAAAISWSVLSDYIEPDYNRSKILSNEKAITEAVKNELIKKTKDFGIILDKVDFILPGYYPEDRIYARGVVYNKELQDLDFANKKDEIKLNKDIIKDRKNYELYYDKLSRISAIIRDNPEILKYIYIDKIGKDVKVIISSDKTGMPAMFGDSLEKTKSDKSDKKEDIDNFR